VSSDDDLVAQELRDRQEAQEAKEAMGQLRALLQQFANATDKLDMNLEPMRR
jgi:hypothetical protein